MATGLRDLFFRISAKDETGAAFASVKKNLSGVDGAARTVRDRFKSFGRAAGAAGAAASVGSVAVLAGLRDSLRLYQVQEKAEVAVATAVKQTGAAAGFAADALYRQAGALQELTSIGDESILADVTAQLLTFGNVSGDVFKRAQLAALDLSATLGSNLRAQTIQLGKALNDPVKGLSALSEAGITFTETQRNIVKAMVEAGEVAKAQNYILDEIAKFYGGQAAAAAGTLEGRITSLSNAWGDLKEQFGAVFAELLPALIDGLRKLVSIGQSLSPEVKRLAVGFGLVFAAAGPLLGMVGLLALGIGAISAPVLAVAAIVAAATAAFIAFYPELVAAKDAAVAFAEGVRDYVVTKLGEAEDAVVAFATAARDYIVGKLGEAVDFVLGTVDKIAGAFDWLYNEVVGNSSVPDLVDGVIAEFGRLDRVSTRQAEETAGAIGATFDELGRGVVYALEDMARDGEFSIKRLGQSLLSLGAQVAGGIAGRGLDTLAQAGVNALGGALGGLVGGGAPALSFGGGAGPAPALSLGGGGAPLSFGGGFSGAPAGGSRVNQVVNIVTPDVSGFRQSQSQVSGLLARSAARGFARA